MSSLTVTLLARGHYLPEESPALGRQAKDILSGSWRALGWLVRALLLMLVALLPWSPAFVGIGWLLLRWRRRSAR